MRRVLVVFCVVTALVVLASPARAADWPMSGGNTSRTGETTSEPSAFPGVKWRTQIPGSLASEPVVSGDGLFAVILGPMTLTALTTVDGNPLWATPVSLPSLVSSPWTVRGEPPSPAVGAGHVYVLVTAQNATTDEYRDILVALSRADGKTIWSFEGNVYRSPTDPGIRSSPLVFGGRVHFGSGDGHVRALYAPNKTVAWDKDLGTSVPNPVTLLRTGNPLLGDFVVAADNKSRAYGLDVDGLSDGDQGDPDPSGTGDLVWMRNLGTPARAAPVATPTAAFVAAGKQVFALHPAWGSTLWTQSLPANITGPLVLSNTTLVFGASDGKVRAVDASDGAFLWVRSLGALRPWIVSTPTRLFTAAAATSTSDDLLALNPATGETMWAGELPAPVNFGSIADNETGHGILYAGIGGPSRIVAFGGSSDLAVRSADISVTPIPNSNVFEASIEATVRNTGDENVSRSFSITVSDIVAGRPTVLANRTVPYLKPGAGFTVRVDSWSFSAGSHTITVRVDTVLGERSTANNVASVTFYASAGPPQIVSTWAASFPIALGVVGAAGIAIGWLIAVAGRRREKELQAMLQERREAGP